MNDTRDKIGDILDRLCNGDISITEGTGLLMELAQPGTKDYLISYTDWFFPHSRMHIRVTAHSADDALEKFWSSRSRSDLKILQITQL